MLICSSYTSTLKKGSIVEKVLSDEGHRFLFLIHSRTGVYIAKISPFEENEAEFSDSRWGHYLIKY